MRRWVVGGALIGGLALLGRGDVKRAVAASFRAAAERFPFSDLLVLPMRARGRVLGTLAVARGLNARPFDDSERMLLQDVADRAAVVLDVARAYASERKARLEAEVAANRILRMQRATAALSRPCAESR